MKTISPLTTPNHIPADPEKQAAAHRELEERAADYRRECERRRVGGSPEQLQRPGEPPSLAGDSAA